jgi:hypothetical protein
VLEQIGRALSALEGTGFGTVVGAVVIVAALVLAGWLIARFVGGLRRDPGVDAAGSDQVGRDPEDWLADAERHELEGRLRDAVRCRYRGLVAALSALGVVDEAPGRTTGEYLGQVRRNAPGAAGAFANVTRAFEDAWYGQVEVTAGDLARVKVGEAAVTGAVRAHAWAGAGGRS